MCALKAIGSRLTLLVAMFSIAAPAHTEPAAYCGNAFSISIPEGAHVTSRSPVDDFVLYKVHFADGRSLIIYEGNAPRLSPDVYRQLKESPSGLHTFRGRTGITSAVLQTGRNWPMYVVLHVPPDWAASDNKVGELNLQAGCIK